MNNVSVSREALSRLLADIDRANDEYLRDAPFCFPDSATAHDIRTLKDALAQPSEQPAKAEQPGDVGRDEARLALFRAIEAIKIGNKTDDKLILDELQKVGYRICRLQNANTSREVTTECNAALSPGEPVAWLIPGDGNARDDGSLDAMAYKTGEFTKPVYVAPPANDEAVRRNVDE